MPTRRLSITIVVVALVGALLSTLMPLTAAAPQEVLQHTLTTRFAASASATCSACM
jgi:hypothetical protein